MYKLAAQRHPSAKSDSLEALRGRGIAPIWVAPDEPFSNLVEAVEALDATTGIVVPPCGKQDQVTAVSRITLMRELSKPFFRDLYWRRTVAETLAEMGLPTLIVTADQTITAAAEAATERPGRWRYDPIVVLGDQDDDDYFLLEVHVLLQGQNELLRATRSKLFDTSRLAGRAEVAAGVIHNVGNVLNSMNVAVATALDQLDAGRHVDGQTDAQDVGAEGDLRRLSSTLADAEAGGSLSAMFEPGGRGEYLPAFLNAVIDKLASERATVSEELRQVQSGVAHIRQVVQSQQTHITHEGSASALYEPVSPREILEQTLSLHDRTTQGEPSVEVELEEHLPALVTDASRVVQVLGNFVTNARWAVSELPLTEQNVRVGVTVSDDADRPMMVFFVQDNGRGFPPREATTLFTHGFTTRQEGHGFGLHSCALAAEELGGTVRAMSAGMGTGARFEIELPIASAETVPPSLRRAA